MYSELLRFNVDEFQLKLIAFVYSMLILSSYTCFLKHLAIELKLEHLFKM